MLPVVTGHYALRGLLNDILHLKVYGFMKPSVCILNYKYVHVRKR